MNYVCRYNKKGRFKIGGCEMKSLFLKVAPLLAWKPENLVQTVGSFKKLK
jgi:hypothetical protein